MPKCRGATGTTQLYIEVVSVVSEHVYVDDALKFSPAILRRLVSSGNLSERLSEPKLSSLVDIDDTVGRLNIMFGVKIYQSEILSSKIHNEQICLNYHYMLRN
jgi:hypothetical protein